MVFLALLAEREVREVDGERREDFRAVPVVRRVRLADRCDRELFLLLLLLARDGF
ncbi:MAG: hypothetical protein GF330_02725 [Candidatus Eisenbacteria bacterium]|nr:hypothetical protein [Candidatus Eisenbacteria bacterium]